LQCEQLYKMPNGWNKFLLQKCRLHSVYESLSVNFWPRFSPVWVSKGLCFSHFCAVNAEFQKKKFCHWFLKGSFLKTVVYYKQDFFRQNQFAPCAGTQAITLKILTILTEKYFWWVTRPPVPHFWFLWIFLLRCTLSFLQQIRRPFFNTWKNHWVPILSIVQPTVKTGTQLFQQLGDTQKSQVFLKRKKLFGGPPLTFKKKVSFCANYFTLNLASCADFLCSQ
jgi:hypothetical protein